MLQYAYKTYRHAEVKEIDDEGKCLRVEYVYIYKRIRFLLTSPREPAARCIMACQSASSSPTHISNSLIYGRMLGHGLNLDGLSPALYEQYISGL